MSPADLALLERLAAGGSAPELLPQGRRPFDFAGDHLDLLASPDPQLRDELFYTLMEGWIDEGVFSAEEERRLLERILSEEFLFRGLGEPAGEAVVARTFGALVAGCLVDRHAAEPYLSREELGTAYEGLLRITRLERDFRGYVAGLGWAHAAAHYADALGCLARCRELGEAELRGLLDALATLLFANPEVYTHQEDKRLARAAIVLLGREEIGAEGLIAWCEALGTQAEIHFSDQGAYRRATNYLNFLRSLFFYARKAAPGGALEAWLGGRIPELMRIR